MLHVFTCYKMNYETDLESSALTRLSTPRDTADISSNISPTTSNYICLLANVIGQSEVSTKDKKPWPVSTFEPRTIEGLRLRPSASIRRGLGLVHQSAHSRLLPIKRDAIGKICRRGKPSPTGAPLLGKK